jgi:hypothetical protein
MGLITYRDFSADEAKKCKPAAPLFTPRYLRRNKDLMYNDQQGSPSLFS